MSDEMIVASVGFLATLIGLVVMLVKPIITLNSNLKELTIALKNFERRYEENIGRAETRLNTHGKEIESIEKTQVNHELRITTLEKVKDVD